MGWSWIVLTLVLNAADDQLPKPPTPSKLPPRVGFGMGQVHQENESVGMHGHDARPLVAPASCWRRSMRTSARTASSMS